MAYALLVSWAHAVVDIVAVVILLVYALRSAAKGFVACLFGLLSTIAAAIVAFTALNSILSVTGGLFGLQGALSRGCTNAFAKINGFSVDISQTGIQDALVGKNIPNFLVKIIVDSIGNTGLPEGTTLAKLVGEALGGLGTKILAFLLTFVLVKLILKILERAISSLIRVIPIVGSLNALLGFVIGVLQGVLLISAVIAILSIIPSQSLSSTLTNCTVVGFFYKHNLLHILLGWLVA